LLCRAYCRIFQPRSHKKVFAVRKRKAVVIGSGIAGLACAARAAAAGWEVDVLEQSEQTGGKLGLLETEGYAFDTGPSLFTQPYLLEELFADCGTRLSDYFSYRTLDEGTQYFWPDGTQLHAHPARLSEELTRAGIPHNPADVVRYLADAARLYERVGRIFLDEPIHEWKTWLSPRIPPALAATRLGHLTQNLHTWNARHLRHPKLVQLFDRFATYNGSDPYRCPAMLSTIAHLEFGEPVGYPEGGMISIPRAVRRLCEDLGARFHTGTAARRILVDGRNRATGVETTTGERLDADAVVSNADVHTTYASLLSNARMARRTARGERSTSGVVFYWGVRGTFPALRLHNIFFSEDYRQEFADLRAGRLPADPTVYVNITSKMEPQHAPPGCENWFVLINAPALEGERREGRGERSPDVERLRGAVVEKISRALRVDVAPLIVAEKILDPAGIQAQTGAHRGALYGTASNAPMAAFNRHPNRSSRYAGLYFCGGTVHPGGGIPLCLRSGRLAAEAMGGAS